MKKPSGRRNYYPGEDMKKWNKGEGSVQRTRNKRQSIIKRRWNSLHGWKNLHTKQPENQGEDTSGKL